MLYFLEASTLRPLHVQSFHQFTEGPGGAICCLSFSPTFASYCVLTSTGAFFTVRLTGPLDQATESPFILQPVSNPHSFFDMLFYIIRSRVFVNLARLASFLCDLMSAQSSFFPMTVAKRSIWLNPFNATGTTLPTAPFSRNTTVGCAMLFLPRPSSDNGPNANAQAKPLFGVLTHTAQGTNFH